MPHSLRCLPALLLVLAAPPGVRAAEPAAPPRNAVAPVRDLVRQLEADLDHLQEVLIFEQAPSKDRKLFQMTNGVQSQVLELDRKLVKAPSRDAAYDLFLPVDRDVRRLVAELRAQGIQQRGLQRAASRIINTQFRIHYALASGSAVPDRTRGLLQDEARSLAQAADDLWRTAQYSLSPDLPARTSLEGDLHRLADAAARFARGVDQADQPAQARRDYLALGKAWDAAAGILRTLPPKENTFLLRQAERVDELLDRLHQALGIEGKRPRFSLRS
jgi:hypothetical protein